jgi:hypothetical protein
MTEKGVCLAKENRRREILSIYHKRSNKILDKDFIEKNIKSLLKKHR